MGRNFLILCCAAAWLGFVTSAGWAQARWLEALDRGVVAVPGEGGGILISWRLLGDDAPATTFDLFRDGEKLNDKPLAGATNFRDPKGEARSTYVVRTLVEGREVAASEPTRVWGQGYLEIPLQRPDDGTTPSGEKYSYTAKEASVGDLDGDGRYEIVLKWDPSNAKDNSQAGFTGPVYLDAYTLAGKRLWRIDLGPNIRAGSHYTQFQVYDLDGDGRAEITLRTADGTIDGQGKPVGDPQADWREKSAPPPEANRKKAPNLLGKIVRGPEYLTVFEGTTGRALASARYEPQRAPNNDAPTPDELNQIWGDNYGNRVDRFLAGVAYLDGERPSIVMGRGYYGRSVVAAWDWRDGKLTPRWTFDSAAKGNEAFGGQGNHQLSIADVDDDGRDEIIYGSMVVDDNGRGLWTSGLRHGDAMHVSDLDPSHPGLEKFGVHEETKHNGSIGLALLDARTGKRLWTKPATIDVGRGSAADIDPRTPGAECWSTASNELYAIDGKAIAGATRPRELSFVVWWDGDELRELFDKNRITKWDWQQNRSRVILTAEGCAQSNGTKNTPVLSGDMLGDWREEVIWRTADDRALRIYTTPHATERRLVTLMHDAQYREAIAWQNTAYNQPPWPSFFLGHDMREPPRPKIIVRRASSEK